MDDDLWHVRMSHSEVKQLTLEQLDDLFRLELIEASTLIWQPGMDEWLPLSVVAGLGDDEPETVSIPVTEPPAPTKRMAQTATSWPPQPAPSYAPPRAAPPPSAPPPPSMRSAPPPPRSAAPAANSSWPAPAAWSNPPRPAPPPAGWSNPPPRPSVPVSAYASTVAGVAQQPPPPRSMPPADPFAPSLSAPLSIAPLATHHYDLPQSGGGSWLVVLALAAGAAVTLYRNDLVHAAARSVGQERAYVQLENALGGPGFGTPRAVAQMAAAAAVLTAATDAAPTPSAPSTATAAAATSEPSSAATSTTTAAPTPEPAAKAAPPAPPPAEKSVAPAPHAAPARAASHAAASSPEKNIDPVFKTPKKGKKGGKGNEYDPLNPTL